MEAYFVIIFLLALSMLSGCASPPKAGQDPLLESTKILNKKLQENYSNNLSIIIGRLDGMNTAVVEGLTDVSKTASENKEMMIQAKGLASTNEREIRRLEKQVKILLELVQTLDADTSQYDNSNDADIEDLFN